MLTTPTRDILFLGRGLMYPLAHEGALKLKEISYIHAEAYASGELKHGPIALIDKNVPVVVLAPKDSLFEKTVSNMQEVMARGGRVCRRGFSPLARLAPRNLFVLLVHLYLDEAAADDACREREKADAHDGRRGADDPAPRRLRVDVAVAHRRERRDRPPH